MSPYTALLAIEIVGWLTIGFSVGMTLLEILTWRRLSLVTLGVRELPMQTGVVSDPARYPEAA